MWRTTSHARMHAQHCFYMWRTIWVFILFVCGSAFSRAPLHHKELQTAKAMAYEMFALPENAITLYVDQAATEEYTDLLGSADHPYNSLFKAIQSGVDARTEAGESLVVFVSPGNYTLDLKLSGGVNLTLLSTEGAEETLLWNRPTSAIKGQSSAQIFIRGFTIGVPISMMRGNAVFESCKFTRPDDLEVNSVPMIEAETAIIICINCTFESPNLRDEEHTTPDVEPIEAVSIDSDETYGEQVQNEFPIDTGHTLAHSSNKETRDEHGSLHPESLMDLDATPLATPVVARRRVAGRAVLAHSRSVVEFEDCVFKGFEISESAGAIAIVNADARFNRCSFLGNTARVHGGGVMAQGPSSTVDFVACTFHANRALMAGGAVMVLHVDGHDDVSILFDSCVFTNNSAGLHGGAISAVPGFQASAVFQNCTISHNEAADNGGGIAWLGPLLLSNVTMRANRAGS
eukprot:Rmarinus@m.11309